MQALLRAVRSQRTQDDIEQIGQRLRAMIREDRHKQAIQQIPGVGDLTASALVAAVGDFSTFKCPLSLTVAGFVRRAFSGSGVTWFNWLYSQSHSHRLQNSRQAFHFRIAPR